MFAWCVLLALVADVRASEPAPEEEGAFAVLGYSFGGEALVGVDGQLRVAPTDARMDRLAADRWVRQQGQATPQQWFNDGGTLLRDDAGYVEYGERFVLPGDADPSPLWHAFMMDAAGVRLGQGVVDALGKVRWLPMQDGEWRPLAVPDRVLWMPQRGPLRFFDLAGNAVLAMDEQAWHWVAGPFPGRHVYVFCGTGEDSTCQVLDEQRTVLFQAHIDALLPVRDGGWWLRERDLWRRVDAQGRTLDAARYQQGGLYPRFQQYGGSAGRRDWPEEVARYATGSDHDTPERGWLLADGHFQALPEQQRRYRLDYCGGRWQIDDDSPAGAPRRVPAALAQVLDPPDAQALQAPSWRVRYDAETRPVAVADCDGRVLLALDGVIDVDPVDGGLLGTFAGEDAPRLWWDGSAAHTVPEGLAIDDDHLAPPLLLVWGAAAGEKRLYNRALGKVVGRSFSGVEQMDARGVVFRRDGLLGLMLADGSEPVPATSMEILRWGPDRTWTRRSLDEGGEELTLLDADHRVLLRRRLLFSGVALETTWQGDQPGHALSRLNLGTMRIDGRRYFVQQWLDREGRVLLSDVSCAPPGEDRGVSSGAGVLIGRDWRLDTTPASPCRLPAALMEIVRGGDATPLMRQG